MKGILTTLVAGAALLLSAPAAAQSEEAADDAEVMALLQSMFAPVPLTTEQQERLPAATEAVAVALPDGFYARMMRDMMDGFMDPLLGEIAILSTEDLAAQLGYEGEELPELEREERRQLTAIIDPAADQRAELITRRMTQAMSDVFAQLEDPMREGLAKAYATRFSAQQLADINAFFATPSGAFYASESMAAFTDPQMMGAMMQPLPMVMNQMPQAMGGLEEAVAELPGPREYDELSSAERKRLAQPFGLSDEELREGMARAAAAAEDEAEGTGEEV